jgi:hypothetical protein
MNISFTVNEKFYLYGEINDLTLSVEDFRPYFKTTTVKQTLNQKINLLLPIVTAFANNKLDNGYKLPVTPKFKKIIKNQKVEPRQGYLLIDGDPDFSQIKDEIDLYEALTEGPF